MTNEHETVGDVLAEMRRQTRDGWTSDSRLCQFAERIERAHAADVAMREAIRRMAQALESGEWAEHSLDSDDDVVRLETQITVLVGALHESSRALIESAHARESAAQVGVPEGWWPTIPSAREWAAVNGFAVTQEWMEGWDKCRQISRADNAAPRALWRQEWHGSGPQRGWHMRLMNGGNYGSIFAYLGEQISSDCVSSLVIHHNSALLSAAPAPAAEPESALLRATRRLVFAARTSGGTAGRDGELCAALDAIEPLLPAPPSPEPPPAEPAALHPKTAELVRRFAEALTEKLALAERKYGYSDNWASPDWMDECRQKLLQHVAKGDPRDVAAYCMFLWHHGERTAEPAPQSEARHDVSELGEEDLAMIELLAGECGRRYNSGPYWYFNRRTLHEFARRFPPLKQALPPPPKGFRYAQPGRRSEVFEGEEWRDQVASMPVLHRLGTLPADSRRLLVLVEVERVHESEAPDETRDEKIARVRAGLREQASRLRDPIELAQEIHGIAPHPAPSDAPASPQAAQGGDPVGDFLRHFETRGDHLFFSFGWEGVSLYNAAVKAHRLASAQPATAKPSGDAEFKVGDRVEWDSGCGKLAATIRGYSLDVDDSGFVDCVPASSLTRLTGGSHD